MKLLVLIPAKLDSKRLANKNIQKINGKTLVEHSIDYAKQSKHNPEIILSSESEIIREIASSNNAWDNTFSYGVGTGLEITLVSLDEESNDFSAGILSFFINARYLMGNEATYLKEGSITFSNPEDGPVQTTFNPSKSKTDILQISIGLHFDFD